jgi:hypothetical protein
MLGREMLGMHWQWGLAGRIGLHATCSADKPDSSVQLKLHRCNALYDVSQTMLILLHGALISTAV